MALAISDQLIARAAVANAPMTDALARQLETYYRLLTAWNEKINLSGLDLLSANDEAIDRILIEPLVAAQFAPRPTGSIVDIGSGGGSPAIPLALALPGAALLMVEAKTRKSVFLREAIRAVGLADARVVTSRADQLLSDESQHRKHDVVSVRAVRMEAPEWAVAKHLLRVGGHLLLFRGALSPAYHGNISPQWRLVDTVPLVAPTNSWLDVLELVD